MVMAALSAAAAATASVPPLTNGTAIDALQQLKSGDNSSSICAVMGDDIPSFCTCKDEDLGGIINCTVAIVAAGVTLDTVGVILTIEPCSNPMVFGFEMIEYDLGIDYSYTFTSGSDEEIPVPGLSVDIPGLGDAGVMMDVVINGNVDALELEMGIDACLDVYGFLTCASTIDPYDFPIWLLDATFDFGDIC